MGATLLHFEFPEYADEEFCDDQAACIPVCPIQEAHNSTMYSLTECTIKNFMSQLIIASVRANDSIEINATDDQPYTGNANLFSVKYSSILFC